MNKKNQVKRIFDSISYRYDLLNHLLSFGIDYYWRYRALKKAKINKNSILLDVACGTGDFSISAKKFGVKKLFAADLSLNMLKLFEKKADWSNGKKVQSVAEYLPYKPDTFTDIIVAFGVRNFYDINLGFESFYRILKKQGKVTILEFKLPKNMCVAKFYLFYFNNILPFVGKIISKDKEAYQYLPDSVSDFDKNINLPQMLKNSGFNNIKSYPLTFGIVNIVIGEK
ncbi:MAG: ubiquinone/menaquinone biosynthesis methyltransferase [bacterium]